MTTWDATAEQRKRDAAETAEHIERARRALACYPPPGPRAERVTVAEMPADASWGGRP